MKNLYVLLACLLTWSLQAQHESIFDDIDFIGGFGGPLIEVGSINGEIGADVGGGGALILNNYFLGGYGMGTDYPEFEINEGELFGNYEIDFGHGGLWFGYTHKQDKLVHLFLSTKVGWGSARLEGLDQQEQRFRDRVFVLTPEVGIEFNVTRFFKIGLTGGYRWVNGISVLPTLNNSDFNSPVGIINFRFGGFGDYEDWDDDDDDDNWW
ncbi:MAG: hypothetical protein AAF798_05835 [Bacteroidota bacterium]